METRKKKGDLDKDILWDEAVEIGI